MEKNESMPLISVIIPVYNSEDVIRRSLDSLLNQTYQNLEIIVVDDGSTDKTPDILRDYQAQQKVKMQVLRIENSGQGKARTVGIQAAEGDLIAFVMQMITMMQTAWKSWRDPCTNRTQMFYTFPVFVKRHCFLSGWGDFSTI